MPARSFISLCGLTLLLAGLAGSSAAFGAGLDPKVDAYFQQHCVDCHGPDMQKGEFRLDTLSAKVGFENTPQWLEVMTRINSGEMPPKGKDPALRAGERGSRGMALGQDEGG